MNNKIKWAKKTRTLILLAILYLSLPVFTVSTNPNQLPLPLLLVPFGLTFSILFVTIYIVGSRTRLLRGLEKRKQYGVVGLLSGIPILLLVFQSLHQLTIRDIIIAISMVFATAFYISRADFLR
jgi:hypothetical protein